MAEVEVYTPVGVVAGAVTVLPTTGPAAGMVVDLPDAGETHELSNPLTVENARWYPLDGSRAAHRGTVLVEPDDILLLVAPQDELKIHMAWYSVALELGPYRVSGQLATHPGFDPARAIARPSGSFVPLRDATIELTGFPSGASATRPHVLVNRYAVDRVTSILMLGHFFPGARLIAQDAVAPVA